MKDLIETIVKPLVDYPDDVQVNVLEEDNRITYQLSVNKQDMGKVIGKQGRVAKAIRTVVYAAATTNLQKKAFLEIKE
ncbi:KH domain-containing protein [Niallia oryzisoli]|uniref:RNA-binding protein KhpA n=1 Tax=Niallia oryzisoli TaxID=1737571 RepID=A0ABZ2CMN1_9BACI